MVYVIYPYCIKESPGSLNSLNRMRWINYNVQTSGTIGILTRNFRRHARCMRHISHCETAVNAIISCYSLRE